jgi:hypothetical protein
VATPLFFKTQTEPEKSRSDDMGHRTVLGFKLATASICFLVLTILSALGLRAMLGYSSFENAGSRTPASAPAGSLFEHRGNLSSSELGLLGSTPLLRARKVLVHFGPLQISDENQGPRAVVMNLFPDAVFTIELQAPSVYGVNSGLLVGQVQGDPESTVRIMIQNNVMDGTIQTRGREFRVIDGANGLHIVTESLKKAL